MDRGVVIGGLLICASFLLAVALNHSAEVRMHPRPAVSAPRLPVACAEAEPRGLDVRNAKQSPDDADAGAPCLPEVDGGAPTPDSAGYLEP